MTAAVRRTRLESIACREPAIRRAVEAGLVGGSVIGLAEYQRGETERRPVACPEKMPFGNVTKQRYIRIVVRFLAFVCAVALPLATVSGVDHVLARFMQHAFERGKDVSYGRTLLAAWADAFPEYGKYGHLQWHLPRAHRAINGFPLVFVGID